MWNPVHELPAEHLLPQILDDSMGVHGRRIARATILAPTVLLTGVIAGCGPAGPDQPAKPAVEYGEAISADGVAIQYEVRGSGDPTIVLLHGWTNSRGIWGEHPKTLATTHRVVALDLAGHGLSGSERAEWTVEAFGEDVVAVVDQLALESVVLVGFSMGAGVAVKAAELLGDRVLGLVFVDDLKDPEFVPDPAMVEQFVMGMRVTWGDTAALRAFAFTPEAPDSLVLYVRSMMPEQPHERWFDALREYDAWRRSDLWPTLQGLDRPVAAINTAQPPTNVEAMLRYAPTFTVDTMEGVGHAGILLRRVEDFDARLRRIIERFEALEMAVGDG
jgi:pimeloyl-ACP methyl ester carboxylesterase